MTYPDTAIDKVGVELHDMAKAYAGKAFALASDPYFREAIAKISVSSFVWALYHEFDDVNLRAVLLDEMKVQSAALERAVGIDKATH